MDLARRAVDMLCRRGWTRVQKDLWKHGSRGPCCREAWAFEVPETQENAVLVIEKSDVAAEWYVKDYLELYQEVIKYNDEAERGRVVDILVVVISRDLSVDLADLSAQHVSPRVQLVTQRAVLAESPAPRIVNVEDALEYINSGGMPELASRVTKEQMWYVSSDDVAVQQTGAVIGDVLLFDVDDGLPFVKFRVVVAARSAKSGHSRRRRASTDADLSEGDDASEEAGSAVAEERDDDDEESSAGDAGGGSMEQGDCLFSDTDVDELLGD
jgi:hypothetical protein